MYVRYKNRYKYTRRWKSGRGLVCRMLIINFSVPKLLRFGMDSAVANKNVYRLSFESTSLALCMSLAL